MSNKRIYYWFLYLAIVIIATYLYKNIEKTPLLEDEMNQYASWIIYGIVIIAGYKNFVYEPRKKDE
jgi:hypothetical protein